MYFGGRGMYERRTYGANRRSLLAASLIAAVVHEEASGAGGKRKRAAIEDRGQELERTGA